MAKTKGKGVGGRVAKLMLPFCISVGAPPKPVFYSLRLFSAVWVDGIDSCRSRSIRIIEKSWWFVEPNTLAKWMCTIKMKRRGRTSNRTVVYGFQGVPTFHSWMDWHQSPHWFYLMKFSRRRWYIGCEGGVLYLLGWWDTLTYGHSNMNSLLTRIQTMR